jgi:integrase
VGLLSRDPLASFQLLPAGPRSMRRRRRALTEAECAALLLAAKDADRRRGGQPQLPFWRALIETGARRRELSALRWPDVDLETGVLSFRREVTKTGAARAVPVSEALHRDLFRLHGLRKDDDGPVFLSPRGFPLIQRGVHRELRRLLKAAGIERKDAGGRTVDVHALRHTAATRLVAAGVPLEHARRILGHASVAMTAQVYAHLTGEDLRDAVRRLPPLTG